MIFLILIIASKTEAQKRLSSVTDVRKTDIIMHRCLAILSSMPRYKHVIGSIYNVTAISSKKETVDGILYHINFEVKHNCIEEVKVCSQFMMCMYIILKFIKFIRKRWLWL